MAKKRKRGPGPCPDPNRYEFVGRGQGYWRLKKTEVVLNPVMKANSKTMGAKSTLFKMMLDRMHVFLHQMHVTGTFNEMIKRAMVADEETGELPRDLRIMRGLDFQPDNTFEAVFGYLTIHTTKDPERGVYRIEHFMLGTYLEDWPNREVSEYRVGLVLVYREEGSEELKLLSNFSDKYTKEEWEGKITTEIPFTPELPLWMMCVRVEVFEPGEGVARGRNVRMMALDAGGAI
jgi:hypothetical protein